MSVKFKMDGQLAIATIASPPMKFLTIDLIEEFGNAAQAALDANARAFLTLAEGDHFCAAADVVKMFVGRELKFRAANARPGLRRHSNVRAPAHPHHRRGSRTLPWRRM